MEQIYREDSIGMEVTSQEKNNNRYKESMDFIRGEILKAVCKNGLSLKSVRPEFQTEEICLAALSQNIESVQFLSDEMFHRLFYVNE